jgi:hypothetical protein
LDFVGVPFWTSKLKNDINYIRYKFSHRFKKVCRWSNIYYSNIKIINFLKIKIMSIWLFFKKLYGLIRSAFSTTIKPLYHAFTLLNKQCSIYNPLDCFTMQEGIAFYIKWLTPKSMFHASFHIPKIV